ncbi:NYN domain-containing protein, partial [Candidatus Dojkabacteria bacterium]|nr:NYN domain-containing protein [Candidatus Dojkabacteria bacterium]
MVKNKDQRVVVLVDVQNLYYSAKNLYNKKVNFKKVLEDAVAGRLLIRAIAYVIRADIDKEEAFFEALNEAGFDIKEKDLQIFVGGAKKGDWDVGLAMDAVRFSERADAIILVSGDGDYIPMVEYIKKAKGSLVELVAFGKTCSNDLQEVVDDFLNLENNPQRYLIPYKNPPRPQSGRRMQSNRTSPRPTDKVATAPAKPVEKPTTNIAK